MAKTEASIENLHSSVPQGNVQAGPATSSGTTDISNPVFLPSHVPYSGNE